MGGGGDLGRTAAETEVEGLAIVLSLLIRKWEIRPGGSEPAASYSSMAGIACSGRMKSALRG